jgi:hypothetical protein
MKRAPDSGAARSLRGASPLLLLALLAGCRGLGGDSAAGGDDAACGDIDGEGTDTGDLPNVLGNWTTTFGLQLFHDGCGVTGLNQDEMTWINGAAMEIDGRAPDQLYAKFTRDEDERFWAAMNSQGGIAFAGTHEMGGHVLHVAFGGLLYENSYLGRDEIQGHASMGVDSIGDGEIDCFIQGDFVAKKSGN